MNKQRSRKGMELVDIKAEIPRELKLKVYAQLALEERTFVSWLQERMEKFIAECKAARKEQ